MENNKHFDYIIVGTGIMSALAYKKILDSKRTVKIINLHGLPDLQNNKNNKFNFKRGTIYYGLGGTSNIWSSTYDFYPKGYLPPNVEEKLSNENLKSVETILKYFNVPIVELQNISTNRESFFMKNIGSSNVNYAIRNKNLFNFSKIFKAQDLINLHIHDFNIDNSEKTIENLLSNEKFSYETLLLAAGGIGNPFLINKYFSKNKNNGKNYMNHLKFSPLIFETKKLLRIKTVTGTNNLKNFEIIPTYLIKNDEENLLHSFRIYTTLRTATNNKVSFVNLIFDKILRKFGFSKYYKILIYTDMKPATNTLEFEDETVILNTSEDSTMQNILKSIDQIKNLLKENPKIHKIFEKNNYVINEGSHHIGTTIMGESQDQSVVNKSLELHGSNNVKVIGTSVLPLAGSGHPTLTAMILTILELDEEIND